MSMFSTRTHLQHEIEFCNSGLNSCKPADLSEGRKVELNYVRKEITIKALTPDEGIAELDREYALDEATREQLISCFSQIALGNCHIYKI